MRPFLVPWLGFSLFLILCSHPATATEPKLEVSEANCEREAAVIQLDVGGVHYSIACVTLLKHDSTLKSMLAESYAVRSALANSYYIDRDGDLFKYILRYLRDDGLDLQYLSWSLRGQLKREAAHFRLVELEADLELSLRLPPKLHLSAYIYQDGRLSLDYDPLDAKSNLPSKMEAPLETLTNREASHDYLRHQIQPKITELYGRYYRLITQQISGEPLSQIMVTYSTGPVFWLYLVFEQV